MGCYVNPPIDKVQWLENEGIEITREDAIDHNDYDNIMLVVAVDNGPFVAAGVIINTREKEIFLNTDGDFRPRRYFLVEASKLMPVSDLRFCRAITRR